MKLKKIWSGRGVHPLRPPLDPPLLVVCPGKWTLLGMGLDFRMRGPLVMGILHDL